MKLFIVIGAAFGLAFSSFSPAAANEILELEKKLQQQELRIDRLELELESLQNRLLDEQYGQLENSDSPGASPGKNIDPLVGAWQCTNNMFNYDITFFEDGLLVQEEPVFSNTKRSKWRWLSENQFMVEQGLTFSTDFRSRDELILENRSSNAIWNCFRIE